MRHWFPIVILTIDFALNANRFRGWKTWLNLAVAFWTITFYFLTNYSYSIFTESSLYSIFDWFSTPDLAAAWSIAVIVFGTILWWGYVSVSTFKDHYFTDRDTAELA
jgi:hypothetical protein